MINIPPIKSTSSIKAELIPDISKTWKVGQILSATAQQGGDALSKVLIRVGSHTLEATTPISLKTGQDIKLLVKAFTSNQLNNLPLLSILNPNEKKADENTHAKVAVKLRQFIAIQQSFSQTQQLVSQLLSNNKLSSELPVPLKNLFNQFKETSQLNIKSINSTQLKEKILNSGIFFESKLLALSNGKQNQNSSLMNDLKFQLLSIKSEISNLIPKHTSSGNITPQQSRELELFIKELSTNPATNKNDALINKLTSVLSTSSLKQAITLLTHSQTNTSLPNEVQSLTKNILNYIKHQSTSNSDKLIEQFQLRYALLELAQQVDLSIGKLTGLQLQPLTREIDTILLLFNFVFKDQHEHFDISFRLQQENKKDNEEENQDWSIILYFKFKTLGNIQSNIHLIGDNVSATFYTESLSTHNKINELLPLLETALKKTGLNVTGLNVENKPLKHSHYEENGTRLLDEEV